VGEGIEEFSSGGLGKKEKGTDNKIRTMIGLNHDSSFLKRRVLNGGFHKKKRKNKRSKLPVRPGI